MQSTLFRCLATTLTTLLVSGVSVASDWTERSNLNLRPGTTDISQQVFDLHMIVLWVCTVIGLAVFALVMYSAVRSEEHTSELQSRPHLVCRLLLEKKKKNNTKY